MLTNLVKVAITIAVEMSLTLGGDEWCRFFQGLGSAGDGGGGGAIPTPQSLWKRRGWEPFVTNNHCDGLYLGVVVAPNPLLHRFAAHSCEEMEVF